MDNTKIAGRARTAPCGYSSIATMASIAFALLFLSAFSAGSAIGQQRWDGVLDTATREGEINVHGGPGRVYGQVLTEGFRKQYPNIKLNFTGLSGRDAIPKVMREREAGIYAWDVYVGGTPSILQTLKPVGTFAPLRPVLALSEVVDDQAWFGGLDAGWMDSEKRLTLGFEYTSSPIVVVNWDFVSKDSLTTFADLLKPEFANKIVWDDPRLPGQGVHSAQTMLINFGRDYLTNIFANQKIVYTVNPRQNAEWVVRGQYPIGIATSVEELAPFRLQGLGKSIGIFIGDMKTLTAGPGFGTVSLVDRAPHPAAAAVYINWLLSRQGQSEWTRTGHNTRRTDVAPISPETFPEKGVTYVDTQSESQIPVREDAAKLAKQNIR